MFVIDTNVVSETFKPRPDSGVAEWMDSRDAGKAHLTAMSKAELLLGLAQMPDGRRKRALGEVIEIFLGNRLKTPILPFGGREAEAYAEIVSHRNRIGQPVSEFDAQIAAIARVRNFAVVTRNVRDFEHCGIDLINPWQVATE